MDLTSFKVRADLTSKYFYFHIFQVGILKKGSMSFNDVSEEFLKKIERNLKKVYRQQI